MTKLSHLNDRLHPQMVDVSTKIESQRKAVARAQIIMPEEIMAKLKGNEIILSKGPVFHTAILAGIMGAKKTSDLIPLCHPLPISKCHIDIESAENIINITCTVKVNHKTGVEMEALTGASIAALTIYDMCKALSHNIVIQSVQLVHKSGGKRDFQLKSPQISEK